MFAYVSQVNLAVFLLLVDGIIAGAKEPVCYRYQGQGTLGTMKKVDCNDAGYDTENIYRKESQEEVSISDLLRFINNKHSSKQSGTGEPTTSGTTSQEQSSHSRHSTDVVSTVPTIATASRELAPATHGLASATRELATASRELAPTHVDTTHPLTTLETPTTSHSCFIPESGRVLAEGETHINMNCSKNVSCIEGALSTDANYGCSVFATCEERDGVRGCYCGYGYYGNGVTCRLWSDCQEVGNKSSRVYTIKPLYWSSSPFDVYCNMDDGGGWTVFQRRVNGSLDFYQNWTMYTHGFGDVHHEYWLGNEKLYHLTRQRDYAIRVDLIDHLGQSFYAEYDLFRIEDEYNDYRFSELGYYNGTAGDSLSTTKGYMFSTHDKDNDIFYGDCAKRLHGGWWYRWCTEINPNGDYFATSGHRRIFWNPLSDRMRYTEIKIRPV